MPPTTRSVTTWRQTVTTSSTRPRASRSGSRGPTVVATPAVRDLHHQVLASGWCTDERAAALKLYEDSSNVARAEGARMQSDAEIVALCERTLTAFLHDFLAKQPGVERVPALTASYKHAGTAG